MNTAPTSSLNQSPISVRSRRGLELPRLVVTSASEDPELFEKYCDGLLARYTEIGAGHLASGDNAPCAETTRALVVLLAGEDVIGGVRAQAGTELGEHPELAVLAAPIAARAAAGMNECKGYWLDPRFGGRGLAVRLLEAFLDVTARFPERWVVALTNPNGIPSALKVGFVREPGLDDVPFPTPELKSALVWFDHRARMM
jgi:hypothetical protein